MGWHLSGVTRTRILVIGLNFSEFLSQEKERRFSFESAGNSSHATCHFANSFLLLPSPFQKWNVFLFIESWSRDQLMQKARPVNLTWKLAIFRRRVFLTRLGLRFTYVNQACHFETNQVHVGGALGERHEINKSSLEIFDCILLITWDQALFSFRFENYIPAGKAKRTNFSGSR